MQGTLRTCRVDQGWAAVRQDEAPVMSDTASVFVGCVRGAGTLQMRMRWHRGVGGRRRHAERPSPVPPPWCSPADSG